MPLEGKCAPLSIQSHMLFLLFALGALHSRFNIQKQIEIYPDRDPKRMIFWANVRFLVPAMLAVINISVNIYFSQNIFSSDFLSPFFD